MHGSGVELGWLLGRRWLRTGTVRHAVLVALAGAAVISGLYIAAGSYVPSASQRADAALGTATHGTYASFILGRLNREDLQRVDRAVGAELPSGQAFLESRTLRPDNYRKLYFQGPSAVVRYLEDGDAARTAPGRYSIEKGRAPIRPGEVAITRSLSEAIGEPRDFTVLSGNSRFRVVGILRDAEARLDDEIMAAPGTWAGLRPRDDSRQYQPQEAQLQIRWTTDVPIADIASALRKAVPGRTGSEVFDPEVLAGNLTTRSSIISAPPRPFGSDQVVVSYGPFALIVLLLVIILLSTVRRPMGEFTNRVALIGIPAWRAALPFTAVLVVMISAGAATGVVIGLAVMVLARPLILQPLADGTLSPLSAPGIEMVLIVVAGLVLLTIGLIWPARRPGSRSSFSRFADVIDLAVVRRFLAGALGLLTLVAAARSNAAAPYLAMAAVMLLTPDLFWLLLWTVRSSSARLLVVRRLAYASRAVTAAAIVALGACVAIPLAIAGQAAGSLANDAAFRFSAIPAGQIWVERSGDAGDVRGVARALRGVPSLPPAVPVASTVGAPEPDGSAGPVARLIPTADGASG